MCWEPDICVPVTLSWFLTLSTYVNIYRIRLVMYAESHVDPCVKCL
jgi:hypothetical protein